VGYISKQRVETNILTTTLLEGLSIGGWVFLWEAFSLFFFTRQKILIRLKRYIRLENTRISFKYK
jgi:hypothetical protein